MRLRAKLSECVCKILLLLELVCQGDALRFVGKTPDRFLHKRAPVNQNLKEPKGKTLHKRLTRSCLISGQARPNRQAKGRGRFWDSGHRSIGSSSFGDDGLNKTRNLRHPGRAGTELENAIQFTVEHTHLARIADDIGPRFKTELFTSSRPVGLN